MGRDAPISNPLICKQPSIQQQHGRVDRQGNNNGSKQKKTKTKKSWGIDLPGPFRRIDGLDRIDGVHGFL